jgi:hypothetical protein|tara:strand:+ start:1656 stop:2276 length:621 start_codon:yes stop_codon:yes gene_type:complete
MSVSGKIDGLRKGKLYLQQFVDSVFISIDSTEVNNEFEFNLSTSINEPDIYYLYLDKFDGDSLNDRIKFFGNSGEIVINSRLKTFDTNAEILGSDNQTLMEEYISIIRKFNFENLDLLEIYYDSQIKGDNKRFDSVNNAINNLIKRKYLYSLNFATTNADYEISPFIVTTEIPDANKELLKQVYDKFNDSIKVSKYGKLLMEIISN